ncbi:MAG: J domain-containing protein [Deltaproteobacteria bacterium]|nr:J domain-containing protein [Deltaproteobacteria bacterium]
MAQAGRTLHVKCTTWEQVETFYTRKLRKGRILSMKVPYTTEVGAPVTLGLELPNGVVLAIDGNVAKASAIEGDAKATTRTWIEVELVGWTDEVVAKLKEMARGDAEVVAVPIPIQRRESAPVIVEELPADERVLFQHLSNELRRLRMQAVHDVLGVEREAGPEAIRLGWMSLVRRHHPDLVARRSAPAITHLAEELTILANRAYDRMRAALVAEGRGVAFGPVISSGPGWLIGFDDLESDASAVASGVRFTTSTTTTPPIVPTPDVAADPGAALLQGGEAFEERARSMLNDGDANTAQEVLAAALCVYPRSRPLRSLYYVAAAMGALDQGEIMLATSQLETAIAHYEGCTEAAMILEHLRKHGGAETALAWKIFERPAVGA